MSRDADLLKGPAKISLKAKKDFSKAIKINGIIFAFLPFAWGSVLLLLYKVWSLGLVI